MKGMYLAAVLVALPLGPHLAAQQPGATPYPPRPATGAMARQLDSLDARLDSLVAKMNRATGNQKVNAMAAVINELVTQRRTMAGRMRTMMESMGRRMSSMRDSTHGDHGAPPRPAPR